MPKKRIQVEDLTVDDQYKLVLKLEFSEMVEFVLEHIKSKNIVSFSYFLILGSSLIYLTSTSFLAIYQGEVSLGNWALQTFLGFLIANTIVIILHEALHGLAYKMVGAPRVSFGYKKDQFIFYAVSNHFILQQWPFFWVAMTPFLVISSGCFYFIFLCPFLSQWLWWSLFFFHSIMCVGDFAMLSFYKNHPEKNLLTYDDVENERSFFYEIVKNKK